MKKRLFMLVFGCIFYSGTISTSNTSTKVEPSARILRIKTFTIKPTTSQPVSVFELAPLFCARWSIGNKTSKAKVDSLFLARFFL